MFRKMGITINNKEQKCSCCEKRSKVRQIKIYQGKTKDIRSLTNNYYLCSTCFELLRLSEKYINDSGAVWSLPHNIVEIMENFTGNGKKESNTTPP